MHRLLLCLVALVAIATADVRPSSQRKISVTRHDDVFVTDLDRMTYDGLFTLEQTHPESLTQDVHQDDVMRIMESAIGPDWRDYVDMDDSQPITYLELIRLSTSVTFLNHQLETEEARVTRDEEGGRQGSSGRKTNFCLCHGTANAFTDATDTNNKVTKAHPFMGVRIAGRGGGHRYVSGVTGHNSANQAAPYAVPRDCLLCQGLINCNACCNGPCTAGTPDNFETAKMTADTWTLGLYPCPAGAWFFPGTTEDINDIEACNQEVNDCPSAIDLCTCTQKRHLLQTLGCTCSEVLVFCDSCFEAWDAIDAYKHCDCEDYALHYAGPGPVTNID